MLNYWVRTGLSFYYRVDKKAAAADFAAKMKSVDGKVEVLQTFALFLQPLYHVKCEDAAILKKINDLPETDFIEANVAEKMIE